MRIQFYLLLLFILMFPSFYGISQQEQGWLDKFEKRKVFIENIGQFDQFSNDVIGNVKYCADFGRLRMFFGTKGINYSYLSATKVPKAERDAIMNAHPDSISHFEKERLIGKHRFKMEDISMTWVDANEGLSILPEGRVADYFNFSVKTPGKEDYKAYNEVKAYEYITYRNIYPNIDIKYEMHPVDGVKYSVILHPGADLTYVRMLYDHALSLEDGKIIIPTLFGEITEHEPLSFYASDRNKKIKSSYVVNGNSFGFSLDDYDPAMEVVIDPWVQNGTFNTSSAVWEVETDGSGNVYVIGGEEPMELKKYNSAGTLLWTYSTPWDTASVWIGTLATDVNGISYVTSGTSPAIAKISTGGAQQWINSSAFGGGLLTEYWSISFNCDNTKLIVGGTSGGLNPTPAIYDINITNGSINAYQTFTPGSLFNPTEVRSISSSKNAKYIYLTHKQVGAINQNIGFCPDEAPYFEVSNAASLSYKCEDYLPYTQNGGGLKALIANDNFFYTHNGSTISKWDLLDGSLIATVNIPGGAHHNALGNRVVECSGLSVDDCGNVYAGATDRVVKFDQNLAILSQVNVPFTVYDVCVNSNTEVLAVGAQLDNSSSNVARNGRIQSVAMSSCARYALICCDANICPAGPFCEFDAPEQLISYTAGGTWSGVGVGPTGIFDPSVAGVGNHAITYTLACGFETIIISVLPCNLPVSVCEETDGTLTATGGDGTYSWYDGTSTTTTTNITNAATCNACGGFPQYGFFFYHHCEDALGNTITSCSQSNFSWNGTAYATGSNTPAPATYPIQIVDGLGATLIINNAGELTPCAVIPLPVELENFNVSCYADAVYCTWTTISEMNNAYFLLERAGSDGIFKPIAQIEGAGTSEMVHDYSYLDVTSDGPSYYRLSQHDYNGDSRNPVTRSVNCSDQEIRIFPNPFDAEIHLKFGDFFRNNEGLVLLSDLSGKQIMETQIDKDKKEHILDLPDLSPGIYLIEVRCNQQSFVQKLVKY